jgi:hypothetical protein
MVSRHLFGSWLDGSSTRLREVLGELEGVSEETLERIDHVSRPSGDGPVPRFSAGRDVLRASGPSGARRERPGWAATASRKK